MSSTLTRPVNAQTALWNGAAGDSWVQAQALLDGMFSPFTARLLAPLQTQPCSQVLDVGCGTGAVSLAIAQRLRATTNVTGIDISEPMLAVARARAEADALPVNFVCADAQRHVFPAPGFDRIVSRFGVMFFDEPVDAFAQLRRAGRAQCQLHAIVWRDAAENAFMTCAERAAAPLLNLPARRARQPGQFAFADASDVRDILRVSGWSRVAVTPLDLECRFPAEDLSTYACLLGPVGVALRDRRLDDATRSQLLSAVLAAFSPFVQGDEVRFNAACWEVQASAG